MYIEVSPGALSRALLSCKRVTHNPPGASQIISREFPQTVIRQSPDQQAEVTTASMFFSS